MRSKEYLSKIRRADGLQRAVLRGIAVEGNKATFRLVTDKTYNEADVAHAKRVSAEFVPAGFTADATVFKSVPDPSAVVREISAFLAGRFPAVAAFISPEDVHAEAGAGGGRFEIGVGKEEKSRFESGGVVDAVTAYLTQNFCGVWTGGFTFKEKPEAEIEHDIPPEEYAVAPRYFKICDYSAIDGAKPTLALYIADLTGETEGVSVCGTVTYFEERQTKNGKPYFSISLNDGSGQLRATYVSKKATLEKVRSLKFGDAVCLTGNNRIFNGGLSFDVKAVDYGAPPAGFVPEPRPSRPVPARYQAVFPEPVSDYVQTDLFGAAPLPDGLVKGEFVVFDLETTGLNSSPVGGNMDRIIEVGAVRIREGKICEKFSTFVACPVRLSEEIKALTGIDDEMLKGAPEIADVMRDFFKFCDGCVLVGHNVQFDIKFVRHYGEEQGYYFDHKTYDTLSFAQELLFLSNYKLNTVADEFGFTFNHHRAFDDAFVTAKIFIELCRKKNGLPRI